MATIFVILIQANDDSLKLVATHIGGSGGIRTHGPISEPLVFKTRSISRTLTHFHNLVPKVGLEPTRFSFWERRLIPIGLLGHINFLGVLYGERSHTIAFTEQCADHYTNNTPKESNLVGPKRIELLSTRCHRIVLAIKLRTNNRFSSDQLSFSRTHWLVSNRRV